MGALFYEFFQMKLIMKKIQKLHQRNVDQFCWRKYLRTNLEIEQSMRAMHPVSLMKMVASDWPRRFGSLRNLFLAVILTADEMKDQYERAMKLHMSNKINEKNVYQLNLNLIDCIHQECFFPSTLTVQVYM